MRAWRVKGDATEMEEGGSAMRGKWAQLVDREVQQYVCGRGVQPGSTDTQ